jgi:hypothetical protein
MRLSAIALAALVAVSPVRADTPPVLIPYRLTPTQHVLVRAKLNGKGPFNFILDTGAPAMIIPRKVAEQAGIKPDRRDWANFDRLELEGGLVVPAAKAKVAELFQLEGMNGMGLADVELHGVIGYNVLARYRIEYDFTRPKLAWTRLDFDPPSVGSLRGRAPGSGGLEMAGSLMKVLGGLLGAKSEAAATPRGFLGVEWTQTDGQAVIRAVLPGSPADKAGFKAGDIVKRLGDTTVESPDDVTRKLRRPEGDVVKFIVTRDGVDRDFLVTLGKGL